MTAPSSLPNPLPAPGYSSASALLAHLRSCAASLVPAERRVAQVLIERAADVPGFSAADVAELAGCSTATVVRACQRLGFPGFQRLRSDLTRLSAGLAELGKAEPGGVDVGTDAMAGDSLLGRVFAAARAELDATEALLDRAAFARAVQLVAAARKVLLLGTGGSAIPAQDAALRFTMGGLAATAPADVLAQLFTARLLGPNDVCVAVSFSGANRHTLAAADAARTAGARIVAVTSAALSPLSRLADVALVTGAVTAESEVLASRITHTLVLNALNLAVQQAAGQPSFGPSAALAGLLAEVLGSPETTP
ncbi:MurR/RpiR family transcriptional regulator [Arthrobacter ginkgonis]|uniref:MurR/RpiR family transcriptional regulator n=1 Tax=Arthrobacter ginkgonis TaxID=1630594 RepID=A0ABP7D9C5_9MICC